jgi:hypothetical protein
MRILDFRLPICDLFFGGGDARSDHDGGEFAGLLAQRFNSIFRQQTCLDDQFHPVRGLVGLFHYDAELRDELGFGSSPASGPVVGTHRCAASDQLRAKGPAFNGFGQSIDQSDDSQSESFGALLEFGFRHKISLFREPQHEVGISDRKSAIGNRQSAIGNRQSAIGNRQSAIGNRQSAIGNRQSAI